MEGLVSIPNRHPLLFEITHNTKNTIHLFLHAEICAQREEKKKKKHCQLQIHKGLGNVRDGSRKAVRKNYLQNDDDEEEEKEIDTEVERET